MVSVVTLEIPRKNFYFYHIATIQKNYNVMYVHEKLSVYVMHTIFSLKTIIN